MKSVNDKLNAVFANTRNKLILFGLMLLTLSCCSLPPEQQPPRDKTCTNHFYQAHQQAISTLGQWQIQGILKLSQKNHSWKSRFTWKKNKQENTLTLMSPFLTPVATISLNAQGQLTAVTTQGKLNAQATRAWLAKRFISPPPLTLLAQWLIGYSTDKKTKHQCSRAQLLTTPIWDVLWDQYDCHKFFSLPQHIIMKQPNLQLEINISNWQLPQGKDPLCHFLSK